MNFIYKTLTLSGTQNEYQRRKGIWYKRKIGTPDWTQGDANTQKVLENAFKDKKGLFFYSTTAKVGGALLLVGLATFYFSRKK